MRIQAFATAIALSALAAGFCRADDKSVRKELQAGYARLCQATDHKDLKAIQDLSTSDFTMDEGGKIQTAKAVLATLEQQFKMMQSSSTTMTIRTLNVHNNQAVAVVDYTSSMTMKDGQGKTHQVTGKGVDEDTWVKTRSGWRMKKVKSLKWDGLMDGKPMKN
jgi:ketosteroid isomerase-like protein